MDHPSQRSFCGRPSSVLPRPGATSQYAVTDAHVPHNVRVRQAIVPSWDQRYGPTFACAVPAPSPRAARPKPPAEPVVELRGYSLHSPGIILRGGTVCTGNTPKSCGSVHRGPPRCCRPVAADVCLADPLKDSWRASRPVRPGLATRTRAALRPVPTFRAPRRKRGRP